VGSVSGATGDVLAYATPMAHTCAKCGFDGVPGAHCPRCGVDVARYRAEMAVVGAVVRTGAAVGATASVAAARSLARPAGFWIRAVAVVIDGVALNIAQAVLVLAAWLLFGWGITVRPVRAASWVLGLFLGSLYPIIFHWQWGQTLGKMAMQIRVVTVAGGPLSLGQAALRQVGSWISALAAGIGYVMAGLRSDKRALHDLIADTRVEYLS